MKRTEVTVRRPKKEETFQIEEFMRVVLVDTYRKEQIDEKIYDLQEELASKKRIWPPILKVGVRTVIF